MGWLPYICKVACHIMIAACATRDQGRGHALVMKWRDGPRECLERRKLFKHM
jgi:hypothetical protein